MNKLKSILIGLLLACVMSPLVFAAGVTSLNAGAVKGILPQANGGFGAVPNASAAAAATSAPNSAGGFVQLNSSSQYPAKDGSLITGISGAAVTGMLQVSGATPAGTLACYGAASVGSCALDSSLTLSGTFPNQTLAASGGGSSPAFEQKSAMFIFNPSDGSFTNSDGSLTLNTALSKAYVNGYIYLVANGINGANAAGYYYFTNPTASTSNIKVWNNIYTPGSAASVPASPTAFTNAAVAAYTSTTGTDITAMSMTIPANSLGVNGGVDCSIILTGSAGSSGTQTVYFGSSSLGYVNNRAATGDRQLFQGRMQNTGVTNNQEGFALTVKPAGVTISTAATIPSSIDTTAATTLTIKQRTSGGGTYWVGVVMYACKPTE